MDKDPQLFNYFLSRFPAFRIDGHEVEKIDQFSYLGSMIDVQGGADADVKTRIGKARQAFTSLKPIWSSTRISLKTKLRLFNSNVNSK